MLDMLCNLNGRSGPDVVCFAGQRSDRPASCSAGYFDVLCGKFYLAANRRTLGTVPKPLRPRRLNGQKMRW